MTIVTCKNCAVEGSFNTQDELKAAGWLWVNHVWTTSWVAVCPDCPTNVTLPSEFSHIREVFEVNGWTTDLSYGGECRNHAGYPLVGCHQGYNLFLDGSHSITKHVNHREIIDPFVNSRSWGVNLIIGVTVEFPSKFNLTQEQSISQLVISETFINLRNKGLLFKEGYAHYQRLGVIAQQYYSGYGNPQSAFEVIVNGISVIVPLDKTPTLGALERLGVLATEYEYSFSPNRVNGAERRKIIYWS